MSISGADTTLVCFHLEMDSRVHLSTVLFDHLDQGGHGFFLLQQLQSWGVWIRDVSQPVFAVVISSVAFSSQQRPRTAFVDRDLWSRCVDITYFQHLKIAISTGARRLSFTRGRLLTLRKLTSRRLHTFRTRKVFLSTFSRGVLPKQQVIPKICTSGSARATMRAWASSTPMSTSMISFFILKTETPQQIALAEMHRHCADTAPVKLIRTCRVL